MTQSNTREVLTAEQKVAYNYALEAFIFRIMQSKNLRSKDMPVIIAPELKLDEGEWIPVESSGARIIPNNDNVYVRLIQPYPKVTRVNGSDKTTVEFHTHNAFFTTKEWSRMCKDNDYRIGSVLENTRLVVEETTEPSVSVMTGKINGGWQPKLAGANGVALMSNGKPIYRRTVLRNTVDMETGEMLVAKSSLVAHDNNDVVRNSAIKRLADKMRETAVSLDDKPVAITESTTTA